MKSHHQCEGLVSQTILILRWVCLTRTHKNQDFCDAWGFGNNAELGITFRCSQNPMFDGHHLALTGWLEADQAELTLLGF